MAKDSYIDNNGDLVLAATDAEIVQDISRIRIATVFKEATKAQNHINKLVKELKSNPDIPPDVRKDFVDLIVELQLSLMAMLNGKIIGAILDDKY